VESHFSQRTREMGHPVLWLYDEGQQVPHRAWRPVRNDNVAGVGAGSTGAKALFIISGLDAALKRRSSTVLAVVVTTPERESLRAEARILPSA
jgi:DNA polymerase IIIc chi subunit